jgi:hypothetical protein
MLLFSHIGKLLISLTLWDWQKEKNNQLSKAISGFADYMRQTSTTASLPEQQPASGAGAPSGRLRQSQRQFLKHGKDLMEAWLGISARSATNGALQNILVFIAFHEFLSRRSYTAWRPRPRCR